MGPKSDMDDAQPIDLGVALFIPYRYMEDRIFRAIQDAGFDDWTLAQARVFQRIAADGSRLTDLADQAQMSKQSAGVLVDQLERLGYVRRVARPDGWPRPVDRDRGTWPAGSRGGHGDIQRDPLGVEGVSGHPQLHVACTRSWINSARSPTPTRRYPSRAEPAVLDPRWPRSAPASGRQPVLDASLT